MCHNQNTKKCPQGLETKEDVTRRRHGLHKTGNHKSVPSKTGAKKQRFQKGRCPSGTPDALSSALPLCSVVSGRLANDAFKDNRKMAGGGELQ